jgi:nicotinate-nucleotide adenylyltransferase
MGDLLGIFGGTFDPPHLGHLILASEAQFRLGMDRVLWVLTPRPPHKQTAPITPLRHRFNMLQLAIAKNEKFEISSVEMDRPGPHYTVDTIKILASRRPETGLVYLMGSDRMQSFPNWNGSAEITALCRFLAVQPRPGHLIEPGQLEHVAPDIAAKICLLDGPMLQISSRDIRARRAQGRPLRYLLPASVFEYIVKNRLYV